MKRLRVPALATLFLLTTACARHPSATSTGPVFRVRVATVLPLPITRTVTIPGQVTREHTALLASREGGFITLSPVTAGSHVRRGTLLAVVGQAGARARLAQTRDQSVAAQLNLKEAEKQEQRYRALYREGAVSTHEYEEIHRRYEIARAQARAARAGWTAAQANLSYARIRAPFPGLVARRFLHEGSFAAPGAPLLLLVGGASEVRTAVAHSLYRMLRIGESVTVSVDQRTYEARIIRMVGAQNPATETHEVRLLLPATDPQPAYGALATVDFPVGHRSAPGIPRSALIRRAGLLGVFLVSPKGRIFFQPVRPTPQTRGPEITIAAGLQPGDQVVLHPRAHLENGTRIIPVPLHA